MSVQLNIITQADLRSFLHGQLDLPAQAEVIAVLVEDDRARALLEAEIRRLRRGSGQSAEAAPQPKHEASNGTRSDED